MEESLVSPSQRADQIGRSALEAQLRGAMRKGALTHGWIIAGPDGAGKATLAYRLARALLAPAALGDDDTLDMDASGRAFRLIAGGAHPDLFVAERLWDEKKDRRQADITVETIRRLTAFLSQTASGGGARVAIIDTADDLNRNAANALLKALEEPPAGAVLFLLSSSPGRLLPTIRSRCRRIDLAPLDDALIENFLTGEGVAPEDACNIAAHARGLPGYALRLAAEGGAEAIGLAQAFLKAAPRGDDVGRIAQQLSGRAGDARWPVFRDTVIASLSDAARVAAISGGAEGFEDATPDALLASWSALRALVGKGEALNLDRARLVEAMAFDLRAALQDRAA